MTTFDDREHAFEAHFALEEELEFKAQARRDRLIGLWAGEQMGLTGEALQDYVLSVMRADLREPGDQDVLQKIVTDLASKDVRVLPHDVRAKMDALLAQARREVQSGS